MTIEKAYNTWAAQYDTNANKTRDLDQEATIATLSKYAFDNVLELGCGTGKNTPWLLTKARQVTGLDFSQEMLNRARAKITDSRAIFQKADFNQPWEIEDQSVDLVTASLTLEHIDDLVPIFQQANQKLKPNGHFFVSELHPFKQYLGSKARFETETGVQELTVFIHHISDYLAAAKNNDFELLEIKEWFDEPSPAEENPPAAIPRLISFVFRKAKG